MPPLVIDAKQANNEDQAYSTASQQYHQCIQIRDQMSPPTIGRQCRFVVCPPLCHRPLSALRFRLPQSDLCCRLPPHPQSSHQSGHNVATRLVAGTACLWSNADTLLAHPSVVAASSLPTNSAYRHPRSVAACLHAPSCCIFVSLTHNGASGKLDRVKMWPLGWRLAMHAHGCSDWILCLQAEHMLSHGHIFC